MKTHLMIFIFLLSMCGCLSKKMVYKKKNVLEKNQIKSKVFSTRKEILFQSVISTFQDLGYLIKTANMENGLIIAESVSSQKPFSKILLGTSYHVQKNATAFIEEESKGKSKVRLNFVEIFNDDSSQKDNFSSNQSISNEKIYKEALHLIEKNISIKKYVQSAM